MSLPLTARTEAGARLLALASVLADDLATSFPHAGIATLREAGYFRAPIPHAHGGLGVESVEDLVIASSRLAQGDASVAIGVNMHLVAVRNMVRRWRMAVAAGRREAAAGMAAGLRAIVDDDVVLAAAISEPGQDI